MIPDSAIGGWVRRARHPDGRPMSKWHKLDSLVEGDAWTRCGKRMDDRLTGSVLETTPDAPGDVKVEEFQSICKVCPD